jgi:predicted AAA+ superfamily ATPase
MDTSILEKLITTWNPHFVDINLGRWKNTIPRNGYLNTLKQLIDIRHIILLTGVRRAGKSTLMQQMIEWLIEEKKVPRRNIVYLYLEDILVAQYLKLGADLLDSIFAYYKERYNPQGKIYLFLDEIQGVHEFNRWIASKYEHAENIKFILSGSQKSLIEAEAKTVLTGRNIQVNVFPFNFQEYLAVKGVQVKTDDNIQSLYDANQSNHLEILHHLGNYLLEGGFPEIVLASNEIEKRAISSGYYRDSVARDVLLPNQVRNSREVELLGLQILSDFTKTHTYTSLSKPNKLSIDTVKNYLDYFTKAYLFFESTYFSYKTKETQDIQKPRKIYIADNGLRNFNVPLLRPDIGQCAENVVYLELMKRCTAVHYWKGKLEVDFAVLNPKLALYNVTYTDHPPEREVKGLIEAMDEFKLNHAVILTKNNFSQIKTEDHKIDLIPLWLWLLTLTD